MTAQVRLEFPIESGLRAVPATQFVTVRNLSADEMQALADATPDAILARVTGLAPEQVARLTNNDRLAIIAARQREMISHE